MYFAFCQIFFIFNDFIWHRSISNRNALYISLFTVLADLTMHRPSHSNHNDNNHYNNYNHHDNSNDHHNNSNNNYHNNHKYARLTKKNDALIRKKKVEFSCGSSKFSPRLVYFRVWLKRRTLLTALK